MGLSNRSKPWFFLSACIVKANEAPQVSSFIEEAKDRIWRRYNQQPKDKITWKALKHHQRQALLPILTSRPYTQIVIGVWKPHLHNPGDNGLKDPLRSYLYCCRFLIERISWFIRDNKGYGRITFEQTDRLDLPSLKEYLHKITSYSDCSIANVFDINKIRVSSSMEVKLLALADNATSSFAAGFNPDSIDNRWPHFAEPTIPHLYSYNSNIWNYGFKVIPSDIRKEVITQEYEFLEGKI